MHDIETLDLDDLRGGLTRAAEMIADRIAHIADAPVVHPATHADIAAAIPPDLPEEGVGMEAALREVADHVAPFATRIGHPRFLAWITTSPAPAGTLGEMLCTGLNQAPLSFKGGPAATVLEEIVLGWFHRLLGFPEGAGGTIVSGGTMANLMGLTVARHAHFPEANTRGLHALGKPPVLYVSDQGHMSIERSASLLGLGSDNVRAIPSDAACRIIPEALRERIAADRREGFAPFCVVGQAGTVTAGAVDPLDTLADICAEEGLWLHVDAAYGGAALLTPHGRDLLRGIDRADSVCIDPHKWFFIPLECGCTLFRNRMQQTDTFRAKAAYLGQESPHDLKNTTFILSRANRALKVWFSFRTYGTARLARIIERNMAQATLFHDLCATSTEWEVLSPVALSIACARYVPCPASGEDAGATQGEAASPEARASTPPPGWTEADIDALQVAILRRLELSGEGFLTPAVVHGRAGIRICVANHRTTDDDIRLLFDLMTRFGRELFAAGPQGVRA